MLEIGSGSINNSASNTIMDVTDSSFATDVLEASQQIPVVVDFWAPWCGPCKTLTPVMEKIITEKAGKVRLAKVNIDDNPRIAQQMGIRSVPAILGFIEGRPIDAFMGVKPESFIQAFVEKLIKNAPGGQVISDTLDEADKAMDMGDIAGAAQAYAAIAREDEQNTRAIAGLARCYLANDDPTRAQQTIDMLSEQLHDRAEVKSVLSALALIKNAPKTDGLDARIAENSEDFEARFNMAGALAAQNQLDEAIDQLFAILEKDMNWQDGKAKAKLLEIFDAAGFKSDTAIKGRRKLSALVFS